MLPGAEATLRCEGVGEVEKCRWVSPSQCCYGQGCDPRPAQSGCRQDSSWRIETEEDKCRLVLLNITAEDDGSVEDNPWKCDLGSGDIHVRLSVAIRGQLYWEEADDLTKLASSWFPSVSVGSIGSKNSVHQLLFNSDEEISITCVAKNTKPEGKFFWRIGNKTIRNWNPTELKALNGDLLVRQELTFEARRQMNGKSLYHFMCSWITGDR